MGQLMLPECDLANLSRSVKQPIVCVKKRTASERDGKLQGKINKKWQDKGI
jgi:hypothetical protein